MTHNSDSFDESRFMARLITVNPLSLIRKMGVENFSIFDPVMIFENIFELRWRVEIEKTNFVEIGMQKIVQNTSRIFFELFHSSSRLWLVDRTCQELWLVQWRKAFELSYIQMSTIRAISWIRDLSTAHKSDLAVHRSLPWIFSWHSMTYSQKCELLIGFSIRAYLITVFSSPYSRELYRTLLMNKWKIKCCENIESTYPVHCSLIISFSK